MNGSKLYTIDDFSPCVNCENYWKDCTGIDGGECEKCNAFLRIKSQFEKNEREIKAYRKFIEKYDLEFELFSFVIHGGDL